MEKTREKLESALSTYKDELERAESLNERLTLLVSAAGNPNAFAKLTGLSVSGLKRYLDGGEPTASKIIQICDSIGFTVQWFLTGQGPMRPGDQGEPSADAPTIENEFALIPGYNVEVAAGTGAFPTEEKPTRKLAFRHRWLRYRGLSPDNLVLVFARGDSMEPTISDNNTLMIDTTQRDLHDGQIYVIRTDGHLIVKRIQKLWNKGILLLSDNKEYREQQVEPSEADDLEVIGRVVWIGKDV